MRKFTRLVAITGLLVLATTFCSAFTFNPTQLTLIFDDDRVVIDDKLLQHGWYNYDSWQQLTQGRNLFTRATFMRGEDTFTGTFPDIVQFINQMACRYEVAADDGRVTFHPHQKARFTVGQQHDGRMIDRERLYGDILAALKGNRYPEIKVPFRTVAPRPASEIIQAITQRSQFTTHCSINPDRENNIALALAKFDGLCVQPHETVSFNKVVGQRTAAQGFREAKIIMNGEYIDGVGGGVCQVSTTLFNAVVQAGLQVVESHHHSLPSAYVPLGCDAMVSGHADFRFTNNSGAPIYIETKYQNQTLTVTIYGRDKGPHVHYRCDTDIVKEIPYSQTWDTNLPAETIADYQAHPEHYERTTQTPGKVGYVVDTYLETYQGHRRLSRKLLRRSTYKPTPAVDTLTPTPTPTPV